MSIELAVNSEIKFIASEFSIQAAAQSILRGGLIHQTVCVTDNTGEKFILQSINTNVFPNPELILSNYVTLYHHLQTKGFIIPKPIRASNGQWLVRDKIRGYWRAQHYIKDSLLEINTNQSLALEASKCFASLVRALGDLPAEFIQETIPHFHDLRFRYKQFNDSLQNGSLERVAIAKPLIALAHNQKSLIDLYDYITGNAAFRKRIMHHDSKVANILFHHQTQKAICPVDFDTTMPGYFFSDIGDMIRSMVPTHSEESVERKTIGINPETYLAIVQGYQEGLRNEFSKEETEHLHSAGLIMLFMQGLRFLTDFLNNDSYYRVDYPHQNLHKAQNQFTVLEELEKHLRDEFGYSIR